MDVFKRMVRDYEEQKKREYELANPCTHEDSSIPPFTWDGRTMCGDCCKHAYRDRIVEYNGERLCMLCAEVLGLIYRSYVLRPQKSMKEAKRERRERVPKIRVFDENGRRCGVRYWK